jgi:RNA polymerase sigma-70 factor, ECF subfamily
MLEHTELDHNATIMLQRLGDGDASAVHELLPLVYNELRALAASHFRAQRADHTLQPTALVHDAFLKMIHQPDGQYRNRSHFFAVAATAMRQILIDHARRKNADKRGGEMAKVSLEHLSDNPQQEGQLDLLSLNDALLRLEQLDPRLHRVVELRFLGGLSVEDVAEVLDVSKSTVESDWRAARAWLSVELSNGRS